MPFKVRKSGRLLQFCLNFQCFGGGDIHSVYIGCHSPLGLKSHTLTIKMTTLDVQANTHTAQSHTFVTLITVCHSESKSGLRYN